jgi:hypothetical protein
VLAGPIAAAIFSIHAAFPERPERAVLLVGGLFAALGSVPLGAYLLARRRQARLAELALLAIGVVNVLLVASYAFWASYEIVFPADLLIWSENAYVNDIVKFRVGHPIFTAQVNNESFIYPPGSQLLTYALAWIAGLPTSIPAYRAIQVIYTLLSTVVAWLCCRRLVGRVELSPIWSAVWLTGLFLIAANAQTNRFTHLLHNDALAQLVCVTAYWLLLQYSATQDRRILWAMALLPALGFWVKQSLILWAGLYCVHLAIFMQPRSFKRLAVFSIAAFSAIGCSIGIGLLLWKDDFTYWVFTVLGALGVSPLRSFKHLLDVWPYLSVGLLGGAVLLRGGESRPLLGAWLVWIALILVEIYTSGVAWMLNHIGPGCLIAGIWFWAALAALWPRVSDATLWAARTEDWVRAGVALSVVCLLFSGFAIVRVPVPSFSPDAYRYVEEVEREFEGQPPERTLLDMGTWVYVSPGVVMKDRVTSFGDRGLAQTGDFSGMLRRLEEKHYTKILVHNLHQPDLWYDYASWERSSGIKTALLQNYEEVRRIAAPAAAVPDDLPYGLGEISVLVPRGESATVGR